MDVHGVRRNLNRMRTFGAAQAGSAGGVPRNNQPPLYRPRFFSSYNSDLYEHGNLYVECVINPHSKINDILDRDGSSTIKDDLFYPIRNNTGRALNLSGHDKLQNLRKNLVLDSIDRDHVQLIRDNKGEMIGFLTAGVNSSLGAGINILDLRHPFDLPCLPIDFSSVPEEKVRHLLRRLYLEAVSFGLAKSSLESRKGSSLIIAAPTKDPRVADVLLDFIKRPYDEEIGGESSVSDDVKEILAAKFSATFRQGCWIADQYFRSKDPVLDKIGHRLQRRPYNDKPLTGILRHPTGADYYIEGKVPYSDMVKIEGNEEVLPPFGALGKFDAYVVCGEVNPLAVLSTAQELYDPRSPYRFEGLYNSIARNNIV